MNIEKLPSGSYRIVQMVNGKRYRITVDHRPTQAEALRLIAEELDKNVISNDMPFERACTAYIDAKSNVVSASTIRGYESVIRQISGDFKRLKLSEIDRVLFQREVNTYAIDHAPKSVRNLSGFISAVLRFYGLNVASPRLPQKEKKEPYIPTEEEVRAILAELKGSKYEVPILLATMGLRRSEICALTMDDLKGNTLTISKAKVQDRNKNWVIKTTKTTSSTREIKIPDYLADLIQEKGLYDGHPELIYRTLTETQEKLGIQHFPLHKLRHFYASYLHDLGYSDKQIQELGGWKTDQIMKTVYAHAMHMDDARQNVANDMGKLFPEG